MTSANYKNVSPSKTAILDAAEALFSRHGFRETTVADIAGIAGMSPANLYRHFENKDDIAAACCFRRVEKKNEAMRGVLDKKRKNATERLEEFIIALLRYTYEDTMTQPKMNQLIEVVIASRPQVFYFVVSSTQSMIEEILEQGRAQKEFAVTDVKETAEAVLAALGIFFNPLFMHLYSLHEFERRARSVAALLVSGLARR